MTVEELRASLQKKKAERLDPLDYPGLWTQRQKNRYEAETISIEQQIADVTTKISAAGSAALRLQSLHASIDRAGKWERFLTTVRPQLCAELLKIPSYSRDRATVELQENLELSIHTIDRGPKYLAGSPVYSLAGTRLAELMVEHGYLANPNSGPLRVYSGLPWQGSLPEVTVELQKLSRDRERAEADYSGATYALSLLVAEPVIEPAGKV